MIRNLTELVAYTQKLASACPSLFECIALEEPGCSAQELMILANALPGLPASYLSILGRLKLDGISIGYFQLAPCARIGTPFVQKLIDGNRPEIMGMAKQFDRHGVYYVASWEADPIAVAYNDISFVVGQIVKYNVGNLMANPSVLADGFEQFLLLAGTLDQYREQVIETGDSDRALREFHSELVPLVAQRTDDMESSWRLIAEVVLGD